MDEQFLNILSKSILTKAKESIRKNMIILEGQQEQNADKKVLEVIKSIVNSKKENIENKLSTHLMNSLILQYTAIYNDNLELLDELLNNNFDWRLTFDYMASKKLFVLDKRITRNFEINEYIKILENSLKTIYYFYKSLYNQRNNNEINKDEIINKFCNIIKKQYNSINQRKKENEINYLNTTTLINFTEEEIINLTETQKKMLHKTKNDIPNREIIVKLIKNYNFSKDIGYYSQFEKYFTLEEISNLTDTDIEQYTIVLDYRTRKYENSEHLEKNAINKIKEIKREHPNFYYVLDAMAYDVLTTKQILSLSENGIEKINNFCTYYKFHKDNRHSDINISETQLRYLIKNTYNKDKVRTNIKKLVKGKQ